MDKEKFVETLVSICNDALLYNTHAEAAQKVQRMSAENIRSYTNKSLVLWYKEMVRQWMFVESDSSVFHNTNALEAEILRRLSEKDGEIKKLQPRKEITATWGRSDVPGSMLMQCSNCGFNCGVETYNYCPVCGATMTKSTDTKLGPKNMFDNEHVLNAMVSWNDIKNFEGKRLFLVKCHTQISECNPSLHEKIIDTTRWITVVHYYDWAVWVANDEVCLKKDYGKTWLLFTGEVSKSEAARLFILKNGDE